jgi:hypothetical protein
MTLNIPSTSVRSKYLKTLPVGCVYKDPKSGYNYRVIEKKLNNTLIKTAIAYLGSEQPISLEEISEEFLKIEHPNKANVMKLMKNQLMTLQEENKRLLENQHKSLYQKIKDNLNGKTYHETDELYYCLHSGLVLPMKKKRYATIDDALSVLEDTIDRIFKDSEILSKAMSKQHSIQSCLYQLLICQDESEIKEILL